MNKCIHEEIKYEGPRFQIVQKQFEREDGSTYIRDCVNPGDAVVILPVDHQQQVIFEKQLREAVGKITLELPAGIVEKGEKPEEAAIRELEEEVSVTAKRLERLVSVYPSAGYSSEKIHIFLARDLEPCTKPVDEEEEILSIERKPIQECVAMALNNAFPYASVNIAIMFYYMKYMQSSEE